MKETIAAILAWIALQTGLPETEPPKVVFVSPREMVLRAFGPEAPPAAEVTALYNRDNETVYLAEDWDRRDRRDMSTLVHELVHHVQKANNVPHACVAALEPQAYALQMRWLREQGVTDPYAFLDIDEFTIRIVSICPQTE